MNESVARVFDRILRGLGLKTLNAQFLLSYALMFGLAACASVALYLSMSVSPETINVAGAQRMLSQKMASEALQLRLGAGDAQALAATIAQYERSAADLEAGNAERNVSRMGAPEIATQRRKVEQIWGGYRTLLDQVAQPASRVDLHDFAQRSAELLRELNRLVSLMSARADSVQHRQMWIAFGCLLAILVLVVLGRQFGLAPLMRQLRGLEVALTEVGAANFTHALAAGHADNEIGRIVAGYERMRQDVSGLLADVKRSAEQTDRDVAEALEQALGAGDQVARQHQDLDQVATAMNEMSATVAEVARHANHAAQSTRDAAALAHEGRRLVEHASGQTGALAAELEHTALALNTLHQHAGSVGQVLTVISSIAEQTNLLALNAAIGGAGGGGGGRGFAVVGGRGAFAGQPRTQQSTQEIQGLIEQLQDGANQAVAAMRGSASHAQSNLAEADSAAQALGRIVGTVEELDGLNQQIATAAEEQSQVAQDIDRNITNVSGLSEQAHEGTAAVLSANQRVKEHMAGLRVVLGRFRT
ncbi:methyl-accepting chemotaxis protein [Pseudomonas paraeruginosa]|nr:methyl-accepting chemotaxis protein [Pseudomonas aeruginosa]PTC37262.1 Methyl-accepting chemotaxis protein [Pseudomonas aeruginosa]